MGVRFEIIYLNIYRCSDKYLGQNRRAFENIEVFFSEIIILRLKNDPQQIVFLKEILFVSFYNKLFIEALAKWLNFPQVSPGAIYIQPLRG